MISLYAFIGVLTALKALPLTCSVSYYCYYLLAICHALPFPVECILFLGIREFRQLVNRVVNICCMVIGLLVYVRVNFHGANWVP